MKSVITSRLPGMVPESPIAEYTKMSVPPPPERMSAPRRPVRVLALSSPVRLSPAVLPITFSIPLRVSLPVWPLLAVPASRSTVAAAEVADRL
ncbi:hypothetical protein D3C84_980950 [compost metagenome]